MDYSFYRRVMKNEVYPVKIASANWERFETLAILNKKEE